MSLSIERCIEKYAKKLVGRTDVEDALKRLDKLTHEEAWMGIAQNMKALHILSEKQLRESVHKWLSPSDPSTNHNIACDTDHKKTASWFFQGSVFQKWKSTGSLLWIHGKRLPRPISNLAPSNTTLYYSWFGKKRSLVCGVLTVSIRDD